MKTKHSPKSNPPMLRPTVRRSPANLAPRITAVSGGRTPAVGTHCAPARRAVQALGVLWRGRSGHGPVLAAAIGSPVQASKHQYCQPRSESPAGGAPLSQRGESLLRVLFTDELCSCAGGRGQSLSGVVLFPDLDIGHAHVVLHLRIGRKLFRTLSQEG